ncbi:MAG TPA: ABC transporter substrate-binding protein [Polyangiaceae bacterium]|nr:ABC transporter substrate-binding protein [Polyangiaceae bacterium]
MIRRSLLAGLALAGLSAALGGCKDNKGAPAAVATAPALSASAARPRPPLKLAYSDWPGWVAWDIAVEKGYFKAAGVDVTLVWLEYVPSMEAFSEGKADAVCMTNGDALVAGSSGAKSVGIVINDYSNGNDMIVAQPGIKKLTELRGKKVAVEVGFVDHLLLMEALKSVGLAESDVDIVNTKTQDTPSLLKAGSVSAIAAWQPNSGHALDQVPGASALFTSANVPGLIYDALFVSPTSLQERRADWKKIVQVWFQVVAFIQDPAHRAEAARIMSQKAQMTPERYEKLMNGTQFLDLAENQKRFQKRAGYQTIYGSSEVVDQFNVANRVYREAVKPDPYFDPSLVGEVASGR